MSRRGFTLIELLIALSIGMLLIAVSWTGFTKAKAVVNRAKILVDLHRSAGIIREFFTRDASTLAPAVAFFAGSAPAVATGPTTRTDTVQVLFMRSFSPLTGQASGVGNREEEYYWVRWRFVRLQSQIGGQWTTTTHVLYRSESSKSRTFKANASLVPTSPLALPGGGTQANYNDNNFFIIPRPLRDASQGVASLDNNRYGVPAGSIASGQDIGDLADLDANEQIVSTRIRDLRLGWCDAAGTDTEVASNAASDVRLDGLYLDVVGPAGNPYLATLRKRPRVMRFSFNIADEAETVAQDFTFSAAVPGVMPPIGK